MREGINEGITSEIDPKPHIEIKKKVFTRAATLEPIVSESLLKKQPMVFKSNKV